MIGILVEIAISWVLLYVLERKNILSLGIFPVLKRIKQFLFGFLITCVLCICVEILESILRSSEWFLNKSISGGTILNMFFWDLRSVVFEELIFRGALLYILIKRIGPSKAILISAVSFGIYHWFSYGIIGDIIPMIVVLMGTGLMGYAWALAFHKTNSIALPMGLHLGWNFTFNTVFSKGPLGDGIFLLNSENLLPDWFSLIGLLIVPLIVLLIVKYTLPNSEIEVVKIS